MARAKPAVRSRTSPLFRRHMLVGWAGLLVFLALGIALETLHGLKINFYLDPRNESRRFMWTLAHSHGTLFSLLHIAFAVSLHAMGNASAKALQFASAGLLGALIVMPAGFFLGGVKLYGGDPGIGVFLVPVGALMLLGAVGTILVVLWRDRA